MSNIPVTKGRLSTSLSIRTIVKVQASASLQNIPVVNNLMGSFGASFTFGPEIGVIEEFERIQERDNIRRYSLGTHAFEPLDVIPSKITTSLAVKRVVLYKTDLLESLGYLAGSLFFQQKSFGLQEKLTSPDGSVTTIDYLDCWLNSSPIKYSVSPGADQLVIQDAKITVGKMVVSTPIEKAAPAIIKNLLPFPFPLVPGNLGGGLF